MVSKFFFGGGDFTTRINFAGATSVENLSVGVLAIVVLALFVQKLEKKPNIWFSLKIGKRKKN